MGLDDLDKFLAMELGERVELAEKVSSLEQRVLDRVQKLQKEEDKKTVFEPPAEIKEQAEVNENKSSDIAPIYQYVDAILPVTRKIYKLLNQVRKYDETKPLRTEVSQMLLALPSLKSINKPDIYAALSACINAASSKSDENRILAKRRLEELVAALNSIRGNADREREEVIDSILKGLEESSED
jgi:hypothetical protein